MRREVEIWFEQAIYDFDTAKFNFGGKRYSASVFFVQQAVEKILKAFYIYKLEDSAPVTHSLIMLASDLKIKKEFSTFLKELTPEFISTRYPDFIGETPYKLYDEVIAKKYLDGAEEIIEWIKKEMKL